MMSSITLIKMTVLMVMMKMMNIMNVVYWLRKYPEIKTCKHGMVLKFLVAILVPVKLREVSQFQYHHSL